MKFFILNNLMSQRIKNKVAIITGGSAGIGRAACELFAQEGAKVVVADIDSKQGKAVAETINKNGGTAIFIRTDISQEKEAKRLVSETVRKFGRLEILVNNAASFVLKGLEATAEDWHRSLGVNVIGTAMVCKYAVAAMKRNNRGQGSGAIVNLGSISGFVAQPEFVAYSTTKAAIIQMTRNLAMDLAPFNIRVNTVCPGTIVTQATERHRAKVGISMTEFEAQEGPRHLLNRVGRPLEVAYPILFLASDEASFITGAHLMVDGGLTAQ
jgi:NAD(P)-dependent dehydrogenase (short-subunit alcohol dehydrogenase family)